MTHYIRLGGISIPDIKLYSVPVFRFEPLVMSEIEGVRTVGLVCASKYIVDIWRTSWTASTIQKWPLASFEGLTVVPIFVSDRFDDRLLRFIHTFLSLILERICLYRFLYIDLVNFIEQIISK